MKTRTPCNYTDPCEIDLWAVMTQGEKEEFMREREFRALLLQNGYPPRRHNELMRGYAIACGQKWVEPTYWKK